MFFFVVAFQAAAPLPRLSRLNAVSPSEAWAGYTTLLETAPLATKCVTATVIIGCGDAVAQRIEGNGVDPARVFRWAVFGLVLQAPWNHVYQNAIDAALPIPPNPLALKVAVDQFVQAPLFTALVFYFFAIIEGRGIEAGTRQIKTTLAETLLKNWIVFIPATTVSFALVPLEYRVLFINCVFFCWVIILSLILNETKLDSASE
ncbi:hypothetical protein CTAYLR_007633 [Chrysophaeum taylorii]|uniref:Uncharacterized protein n=1 Tax=Chrysophaeum taylorii TaxID=2483200 RepID=A0AAD7UFF9_9STRA|nr:hypothetical protein CTAYLR_007633 [Chrysophaeum taylorii]